MEGGPCTNKCRLGTMDIALVYNAMVIVHTKRLMCTTQ